MSELVRHALNDDILRVVIYMRDDACCGCRYFSAMKKTGLT